MHFVIMKVKRRKLAKTHESEGVKMKKLIVYILALAMLLCLTACTADVPAETQPTSQPSIETPSSEPTEPEASTAPTETAPQPTETAPQPTQTTPGPTETVPSHIHDFTSTLTMATCTEPCYSTYTCECGYSYQFERFGPTHTWSTWEYTGGGPCATPGYYRRKCSTCGKIERQALFGDHSYNADRVCTACGVKRNDGMSYSKNAAGTHYALIGVGSCKDTRVVIPPIHEGYTVNEIGQKAFADYTTAVVAVIPDSVTVIGNGAFEGCTNLVAVTIPDSVTSIGGGVFWRCTSLTDVHLPSGITEIPATMFWNCTSLQEITIPEGVTRIQLMAFDGCTALRSISLPSTLTEIGLEAFALCVNLEEIHFAGTKAQWEAVRKGITSDGEREWDAMTGDYTVYCTDGEIKKS